MVVGKNVQKPQIAFSDDDLNSHCHLIKAIIKRSFANVSNFAVAVNK